MESLLSMSAQTPIGLWVILILASLGTYAWRALGVLLSGKLNEGSPMFRWVSCVTYAMVAALVVRIIVLPIGVLAQVPLSYRLLATGTALAIVLLKKDGFVPAIVTGTLLITLLSWLG
jgi:branched-subunit amino acid transport protein